MSDDKIDLTTVTRKKVPYPEHPERCQAIIGGRKQCDFYAVPGGKYCVAHGGHNTILASEREKVRNYRLQKYQQRLDEFQSSNQLKNLREEVGILRILLEEKLNSINDNFDLVTQSSSIADLTVKVTSTVLQCQKLDEMTSRVLDKTQIVQMVTEITEIINTHVKDETIIDAIATDIEALIERQGA
jgi:hypothetical protein